MAVPLRLTAFALALVVAFGLSFGIGRATGDPDGPVDEVRAGTSDDDHAGERPDGDGRAPGHGGFDHKGAEGG